MNVPDKDLMFAMADVLDGRKVLILTPNRLSTDAIVQRAMSLVGATLVKSGTSRETVDAMFTQGTSPWHICTPKGGWAFFFPVDEIDPSEDVQNPNVVYYPTPEGYRVQCYKEWQAQSRAVPRPGPPKNVWEHLLDDE